MPEPQNTDTHTTMDRKYILHIPTPANPDGSEEVSTFTTPIFIEMGEESGEHLEALVQEKTGEIVKADKDWTHLPSRRSINASVSIDTSVVGGFMFQSDAGSGCWIEMTEDKKLPIRILIDREQDFSMFLVVVLRHEKWKTSGDFYLRFLRRVAVFDKPCLTRIEGPFAGPVLSPSDTGMSSNEEPELSTADLLDVQNEEEQVLPYRAKSTSTSPSAQTPSDISLVSAYVVPLAIRTRTYENDEGSMDEDSTDEDLTEDEDHRSIGAAALRRNWGGH